MNGLLEQHSTEKGLHIENKTYNELRAYDDFFDFLLSSLQRLSAGCTR